MSDSSIVSELGNEGYLTGTDNMYSIDDNSMLGIWTFTIDKGRLRQGLRDALSYKLIIGQEEFELTENSFISNYLTIDIRSDDYNRAQIEAGWLKAIFE